MGKIRKRKEKFQISITSTSCSKVRATTISDGRRTYHEVSHRSSDEEDQNTLDYVPANIVAVEDDGPNVSTSKSSLMKRGIGKAERTRLRHRKFVEKVEAVEEAMKEKQKEKKPKLTDIPKFSISSNFDVTCDFVPPKPKAKGTLKSKKMHQDMLRDVAALQNQWDRQDHLICSSGYGSDTRSGSGSGSMSGSMTGSGSGSGSMTGSDETDTSDSDSESE